MHIFPGVRENTERYNNWRIERQFSWFICSLVVWLLQPQYQNSCYFAHRENVEVCDSFATKNHSESN